MWVEIDWLVQFVAPRLKRNKSLSVFRERSSVTPRILWTESSPSLSDWRDLSQCLDISSQGLMVGECTCSTRTHSLRERVGRVTVKQSIYWSPRTNESRNRGRRNCSQQGSPTRTFFSHPPSLVSSPFLVCVVLPSVLLFHFWVKSKPRSQNTSLLQFVILV